MRIELDHQGIISLILGTQVEPYHYFDPFVKKYGSYNREVGWKWNMDTLALSDDIQLYILYKYCRKTVTFGDMIQINFEKIDPKPITEPTTLFKHNLDLILMAIILFAIQIWGLYGFMFKQLDGYELLAITVIVFGFYGILKLEADTRKL